MKLLSYSLRFVKAFASAAFVLTAALVAAIAVVVCHGIKAAGFGEPILALGANTLTSLVPDCYAALDVVSRELTGFIPSVFRDASTDRVAQGQTLRVPAIPTITSRTITPAMAFPSVADQVVTNKTLTITKQKVAPFNWSGEEQMAMDVAPPQYLTMRQAQIAQAFRVLVNEIEADLSLAAVLAASRAFGTAGTTPFASTLGDPAQIRKILDDNGAPLGDRSLVINTAAGANMRTLAQLNKSNESGADGEALRRQGLLMELHNFFVRESAQILTPAIGTSNGAYTTTAAGFAVGTTSIPLITGAGTIVAGDVITFAGDTNKYVVTVGIAAPGTIQIAAPGLLVAMSAATKAVTTVALSARNVGFSRNALLLSARLPAVPQEGDLAILREVLTDDRSGLSFELAVYPGYRMLVFELGLCWGTLAVKPEHIALLLG